MKIQHRLTRYCIGILTLSFSCPALLSQTNRFNGFFIDSKGDTISGFFPKYKQWNYNPAKVTFLPSDNGKAMVLTPANCKEFHVENYDTYVSFRGTRLTNPIEYSTAASVDSIDFSDTITTFLREIISIDLYKFYVFKDRIRLNLYYSTNNKDFIELRQKASIINNLFWQSMTYKEQLKELFPLKTEEIDDLLYSEESLVSLMDKQKGITKHFQKMKDQKGGFYLIGGVSLNSLKFNPEQSLAFSTKKYPSKLVPLGAIGYIVPIGRNFSKVFFFPQIKFFSFKHSAHTTYNDSYPAYSYTFQSSPVISLGLHFGYNIINHPNLKVAIAPGGGVNFLAKNKQIDDSYFSPTLSKSITSKMGRMSALLDVQATVIARNRYGVWFAYNFPSVVTNYSSTNGKLSSAQAGVGYRF